MQTAKRYALPVLGGIALAAFGIPSQAAATPDAAKVADRSSSEGVRLGVLIDAGLPDGAGVSVALSPAARLRLHAGIGHNAISPGLRLGVAYIPARWRVAPVLAAEAGHYFEGDARPLLRRFTGDPRLEGSSFERVGYSYAAGRAGVEVGVGATRIFFHAGLSVVRGKLREADALFGPASDGDGPRLEIREDPDIRALIPSARAGFLINF